MFSSPVSIRLSSGTSRVPARGARRSTHADLDDVLARYFRQAHFLDRIGQAEMEARRFLAVDLPKAHDDAEFIRADRESEGEIGDDRRHDDGTKKRKEPGMPEPPGMTCFSRSWLRLRSSSRSGCWWDLRTGLGPTGRHPRFPCDHRHSDCSKASISPFRCCADYQGALAVCARVRMRDPGLPTLRQEGIRAFPAYRAPYGPAQTLGRLWVYGD